MYASLPNLYIASSRLLLRDNLLKLELCIQKKFFYGIPCSKTLRIVGRNILKWLDHSSLQVQQRAFTVSEYYRNNANVYRVLQRFQLEYPTHAVLRVGQFTATYKNMPSRGPV